MTTPRELLSNGRRPALVRHPAAARRTRRSPIRRRCFIERAPAPPTPIAAPGHRPSTWSQAYHLPLAAEGESICELPLARRVGAGDVRCLYAVDLYRFPGEALLHDGADVYTPDRRGRFTTRARQDADGWPISHPGGGILVSRGLALEPITLKPDP